jgi:hypothetical protein
MTRTTSDHERKNRRGSGCLDDDAAADKETGPNDAAESNHRHVPLLEAVA